MAKKNKILLAYNDRNFQNLIRNKLEPYGYIIHTADTPDDAKEILKNQSVDLAIIDIRLTDDDDPHDMSGIELASSVDTRIPKIVLTSYYGQSPDLRLPQNSFAISKFEGISRLLTEIQKVLNSTNDIIKVTLIDEEDPLKTNLTPQFLLDVLTVYICALANLQNLINEIRKKRRVNIYGSSPV